jgi:hypothetical protein
MAGKPFAAAWSLVESLEPSTEAAKHLSRLLRNFPSDTYKTEGMAEALTKWRRPASDIAAEKVENAKARVSSFQQVRQSGARILAGKHDGIPGEFLANDEIAIRCGAYKGERKLTAEQTRNAVECTSRAMTCSGET